MTNRKDNKHFANTLINQPNAFYDATEEDLLGLLNDYIYLNESKSAKNLILYINWCYESGSSPNPNILEQFISHAFKRIVEEAITPDQAFCFKNIKGKYLRPDNLDRNLEATIRITLLMRKGFTYLDACEEVAGILCPDGKGERAIQHAYSLYRVYFQSFSDNDLEEMLKLAE